MGNKRNVFEEIKSLINKGANSKVPMRELLRGKPWGRNVETFYVLNLYKLGYLEGKSLNCSGNKEFIVLKKIPDGYNASSLRKEMKEKKF